MHPNYKQHEKAIKNIILWYISVSDPNKYLRFIIYYKIFKTSNLIIANNIGPHKSPLCKNNVVYELSCPLGDCFFNTNNQKNNIKYLHLGHMYHTVS